MANSVISRKSLYSGPAAQERDEIEGLPSLLVGKLTFVDVGASFGQYARCANDIIRSGHIIAIEADPPGTVIYVRPAKSWPPNNTVETIHAAISDVTGTIPFFVNGEISGSGFVSKGREFDIPSLQWKEIAVNAVTLDDVLKDRHPDFIKIDIEGFEYRAILGARDILRQQRCVFLIEVHPWGDPTINKKAIDVFELFYQNGYGFRRYHRHWLFHPFKSRASAFVRLQALKVILKYAPIRRAAKQSALLFDRIVRRRSSR